MRAYVPVVAVLIFSTSVLAFAQSISIPKPVPYAADNEIAGKIKRECGLDTKLADFIVIYAKELKVPVNVVGKTVSSLPGRVLVVEIKDAVSMGNAFLGHHKSTAVSGEYFVDGKLTGSFRDRRNSMGGAFAGFKGSCSVLGRTVKAIGKDVAQWLVNPVMDADLGDLE